MSGKRSAGGSINLGEDETLEISKANESSAVRESSTRDVAMQTSMPAVAESDSQNARRIRLAGELMTNISLRLLWMNDR